MGGMYRSTEAAYFTLAAPYTFTLPGAFGGNLTPSYVANAGDDALFSITDEAGALVCNNAPISGLPSGITHVAYGFGGYFIKVTPAALAGFAQGTLFARLRDSTATNRIIAIDSCQWGGTVDLLTQVPAQVANSMINDGGSYRSTQSPLIVFNAFVNPATGMHEDASTTSATLTLINPSAVVTTPACTYVAAAGVWAGSPAAYALGHWYAILSQVIGGVTYTQAGAFIWGESNLLFDGATKAQNLPDNGALTAIGADTAEGRMWLSNRVSVDYSVNPAVLTLYDDAGNPTLTRLISNGDGSDVDPAQVLNMTKGV